MKQAFTNKFVSLLITLNAVYCVIYALNSLRSAISNAIKGIWGISQVWNFLTTPIKLLASFSKIVLILDAAIIIFILLRFLFKMFKKLKRKAKVKKITQSSENSESDSISDDFQKMRFF